MRARLIDGLRRHLHPAVLAPLASVLVSARRRELCLVRYRDGDWVHRYRDGIVVQPRLGGPSARLQDQAARDSFLFDYTPKLGDIVFDLGAGIGGEVRLFSRLVGPAGLVISVEAHPRIFRCLERAVRLNRLENASALHLAMTGSAGTFYIEDDQLAHVANRLTDASEGVAVHGCTLSDLMERACVDHIDLLKMNIEGAELAVLQAAGHQLETVDHIAVACHDFTAEHQADDGRRTFAPVVELLGAAGFRIRTRPDDRRPWVRHHVYGSRTTSR